MWEIAADKVTAAGATLEFDRKVTSITHDDDGAYEVRRGRRRGQRVRLPVHARDLVDAARRVVPGDGPAGRHAHRGGGGASCATATTSRSRSSSTQKHSFSDNWIYVHDPDVEVGRVQNYGSWSPFMVKEGRTCLGLEYFVNEGDRMWTKPDAELIEQGKRELCHLGLVDDAIDVEAGLRRADAEGVSRVRRELRGARHHDAQVARGEHAQRVSRAAATACTSTTTRTTRCSPRCSRSRTSSAPTTTCGRVNVEAEYLEQDQGGDVEALDRSRRAGAADARARRRGPGRAPRSRSADAPGPG